MKKELIIGIIVIFMLIIAVGIYYLINKPSSDLTSCAKVEESCGGGIQGPNGESNNVACCSELSCSHTSFGEYSEIGVCINEDCAKEGENVYDMSSKGPTSCCTNLILKPCEGICTPSILGICIKQD